MATCLMFGTMTQEARKVVHTKRTKDAEALIKQHGSGFDTLAWAESFAASKP